MTAVLAEHAKRLAGAAGDTAGGLRAEAWLAHGLVAVGRGVSAVPLAAAALPRAARGADPEVEARLRVELASVAHDLGETGYAESLLAPFRDRRDLSTALRADIAAQVAVLDPRNRPLVDAAVGLLRQLGGEAGELGMARVDALLAQQLSEDGQPEAAIRRARDGLRTVLGERPAAGALEPVAPHLALRLAVELSLALVKVGHRDPINAIVEPMLGWQARSASLAPAARLRLALAGQVQLPAGEHREALAHVGWVSRAIAGEDLPELETECHQVRAKLAEARGELTDALAAGRAARVAHRLYNTRVEHTRQVLAEVAGDVAAAARPRNGRARTDSPAPSKTWTEPTAASNAERIEQPPFSSSNRSPVWGDAETDPEAVWLSPTKGRAAPATASPSSGQRWMLAAELAEELAGLDSARPAHLVVVDIATPSGSVGGWARTALATAVADQISGQLGQGALLHLLAPDIVTIALPQTDPRAVNRWVRAVSGRLSRQWPTLSTDLPHATFRIAIRPLDPSWSMEEHVRDVSAQLLDGRESKVMANVPPGGHGGPVPGRHAGANEPAVNGATPDWLNARPGSGGRRRRPDLEPDAAPPGAHLSAGEQRRGERSGDGRSPELDPLTGDINGLVDFASLAGFDDLATFNEVPESGDRRRRRGVPDTPPSIEGSGAWDFSRYDSAHQSSDAVGGPAPDELPDWDDLPRWDDLPSRGELAGWDVPPRRGELLGLESMAGLEPAGGVESTAGIESTGIESTTSLEPTAGIESTADLVAPKGPEATAKLRASASPETTAKLAARRGGEPADFDGQPALAALDDLGAGARRPGDAPSSAGRRRAQPTRDETGSGSGTTFTTRPGGRGRDNSAVPPNAGRHTVPGGHNTAEARPDPGTHRGVGARNGAVGRNGAGDRGPVLSLAADAVSSTAWLPVGGRGAPGVADDTPPGPDRGADEHAGLGNRGGATTAKPPARGRATPASVEAAAGAEVGDQVERPVGNDVRQSPSGRAGHRSDGDVARRAADRAVPTVSERAGQAAGTRDKDAAQVRGGEQDAAGRDRARGSEVEEIRRRNLDRPVSELTFAELIDGALAAYREG